MARIAKYLAACVLIAEELATHPKASAFKQAKDYAAVVGNDTRNRATTEAFLAHVSKLMPVDQIAARAKRNDRYGHPLRHAIDGRKWSAGSLRFLQVAEEIGSVPAVIEIGGGYGGQRLLCDGIANYTIVDLPEALAVQRAYLGLHGVETALAEPAAVDWLDVKPGTFLLSDYALSELSVDQIDHYMDRVVARCDFGRVTCRDDLAGLMEERLRRHFPSLQLADEIPKTTHHRNVVIRFQKQAAVSPVSIDENVKAQTTRDIAERLQSSEPWAFSRWGDGEWSAILGRGTANCDGQAYVPSLRSALRKALLDRPSYQVGMQPLALSRLGSAINRWLREQDVRLPWVNADVFHDRSKAGDLLSFIEPLKSRNVLMVGPASLRSVSAVLPYAGFVEVPEQDAFGALDRLRTELSAVKPGTVVALSAGMSANLLIHELHHQPGTTWIDFGSVWEPYVGRANRSYHAAILERERAA